MLSPEIWQFEAPHSNHKISKGDYNSANGGDDGNIAAKVNKFYYNHLVSLVLPDTSKVPEFLTGSLTADCEYYKVLSLNVSEFADEDFVENFVKKGSTSALSLNTRIDCDDCICLTPDGRIVLSLKKETYQRLGLEGKRRQVPPLQALSARAVGGFVVGLAPHMLNKQLLIAEPQKAVAALRRNVDRLRQVLAGSVPCYLYDEVAVEVLSAVKLLIEKTKKKYYPAVAMAAFLTEMNVIVSLTEVVLGRCLKNIDFLVWPKIMRYVMYKNLDKLSGLEVLNLGSCTGGWRNSEYDRYIMDGVAVMKNLRSLCLCFDCTDCAIQIIGENCPHLQCLDVTSSRSVTDRSVPSLLKCAQLKELQLHRTSVSLLGFAELILGLPNLQDLGRCDEIGRVIRYLHQNHPNYGPFGLKKLQTRDMSTENLRLFVDACPKVEFVSLFHDEQMSDLTVLTALDNLKELKLLACAFYGDFLQRLLKVRGQNMTDLHLEHVEELDLNALHCVSQYCPNLKSLVLYNCDFVSQTLPREPFLDYSKVRPFQNLERVFWMVDCAITHLEFLLVNAVNIKNIHLGSSTGITHASIVNILATNPMKELEELRILFSSDMSIRTVEMLLRSCSKLKVLSELENWQGISVEELQTFKQSIRDGNFDLDIRPTLTYY